jgi:hypothetical protein
MTWSYRISVMRFGKWIGRRPVLRSAGLAMSLAAPGGPPAPPPADKPPIRSLVIYPAPSRDPVASFVGVIGDSTGTQLAEPLAAELNPRGVSLVRATLGGCQPTDTVLTYGSREYFQRHQNCPHNARENQNDMVFRFRPRVVVWADIMEWSDIEVNNRIVVAGSEDWKRLMLEGWNRTLDRLGRADVVLILPTWWAGWPRNTPASFPVEQQRVLFQSWAERHPGRVTVVDLGPVICPAGPPCQQVVDGVQLRTDHVHYTPEGARRAIAKIMADAAVLKKLHGPVTGPASAK